MSVLVAAPLKYVEFLPVSMKTFEERKAHALWRIEEKDRSKKGSVDKPAWPLLDAINDRPDMYTTSSCSGRILLLCEPDGARKDQYDWPIVTHETADADAFIAKAHALADFPGTVWLRMQTVIIHVACKDLKTANTLLDLFHAHGWKRSGIFSTANDVMVELLSVEGMDTPIIRHGSLLVSDEFISEFITLANEKLSIAHEKIQSRAEALRSTTM